MKDGHLRMSPSPSIFFFFFTVSFLILPFLALSQNMTTLKIAVPVRKFSDFVSITTDTSTNNTIYSGFAIDVFTAVLNNAVETPIPFEFFTYPINPDGTMNATFDDMLKDVSSKTYDGAAGDIAIRYTRTQSVGFTMPYLDASISMLVSSTGINKGFSVRKVTKYVVVTSLAFTFIVALLFWILEYRNDKIATSPRQVNDDNWPREMLGLMTQTRLVMIMFFMVLLVLIACYTASQTSSLAPKHPTGGYTTLEQLREANAHIGYKQGSYMHNLLKLKGIQESNLISVESLEDMVEKLSKGTALGGVDAIVADTPNLKILVAKHCADFTIVPTDLHSAGFGFAFYPGFGLLKNVSRGILKIMDDGRLGKIQDRTIGSLEGCPDDDNAAYASTLVDSDSLWILIAGAVAVFLLIIIILVLYCGMRGDNNTRKKVVAFPCYISPCC